MKGRAVLIRADASPKMGGGHVIRTSVLGAALREAGATVVFAATSESFQTMPLLKDFDFDFLCLDCAPESEIEVLRAHVESADLFILDHYHRGVEYEQSVREFCKVVMVMEDVPNRTHDCDVLLDQTLGRQRSEYEELIGPQTACLFGPRYALLRPQFDILRQKALERPRTTLGRILVMVGGSDPRGVNAWVLQVLAQLDFEVEVDLVLGALQVQPTLDSDNIRMTIHRNVHDMASLMITADLAIGAAGSASWERCCLGTPALLFVLAENQRQICEELDRYGAAINLGDFTKASQSELVDLLSRYRRLPSALAEMGEKASTICDGLGCSRVLEVLRKTLASD